MKDQLVIVDGAAYRVCEDGGKVFAQPARIQTLCARGLRHIDGGVLHAVQTLTGADEHRIYYCRHEHVFQMVQIGPRPAFVNVHCTNPTVSERGVNKTKWPDGWVVSAWLGKGVEFARLYQPRPQKGATLIDPGSMYAVYRAIAVK